MSYFIPATESAVPPPNPPTFDTAAAFEAAPVMIWFCDLSGKLVYANSTWRRTTGIDPTTATATTFVELVHPTDRHQTKLRREELPGERVYRLRLADGRDNWVKETVNLWRDGDERVIGYAICATNIDAQIRHERQVQRNALRQSALHRLAQLVLRDTPENEVQAAGLQIITEHLPARAALLWPGPSGDVQPAPVAHLMPPLPRPEPGVLPHEAEEVPADEDRLPWLSQADFPPGSNRALALPLQPGDSAHGTLLVFTEPAHPPDIAALTFAQSIASLLLIAQAREENHRRRLAVTSHAQLAQKMEAVGLVAGGVAHDFNNMLTAIRCCGEMLRDELGDTEHRAQVDDILHAATGATQLVRQLVTFSRRDISQPEVLNLVQHLDGLRGFIRSLLSEHIELDLHLPDEAIWVSLDPREFEQVLFNLCLNARDAMPTSGRVTIALARTADGMAAMSVTDNGQGMSAGTRERLFTPFFTTKAKGRGTGLGLATSLAMVEGAGGTIRCDSESGRGTTFTVLLPLTTDMASAAGQLPPDHAPPRRGCIMLVEDDDLVRSIADQIMQLLGYRTKVFSTATAAWNDVGQQGISDIDALVTDIVMPGMNGHELAERLKELRPDLPTLYMSGFIDDPRTLRAIAEPGVHFLSKPFSAKEFKQKLFDLLPG